MNHKEFFERYADYSIGAEFYGIMRVVSMEELYQLFKARMADEAREEAKRPQCDYQGVGDANQNDSEVKQ